LIYNECEINSDLSLIQNVDHDEDMSGERGCFFKDGKRRIGTSMPSSVYVANTIKGRCLQPGFYHTLRKQFYKWMSNVSCVKL